MNETELMEAASRLTDDPDAFFAFTARVLPTFFGKAVVTGIDWRKAARAVLEESDCFYDMRRWLAEVNSVAHQIHMADDDSWFTREYLEHRRAIETGEICLRG